MGLTIEQVRLEERKLVEKEEEDIKHEFDQYSLFHVTSEKNVPLILQEGLKPALSEFTVKAYARGKYPDVDFDHEEDDWKSEEGIENNDRKVQRILTRSKEKLRDEYPHGLVFATEFEDLSPVLGLSLKNEDQHINDDNLAIIGIKPECKKDFRKEEIASDVDYISETVIPSHCLGKIDKQRWKKIVRISRF